jgi:D-amino-acid dehydrogenase
VFEGHKAFEQAADRARMDSSGVTRQILGAQQLRMLVPALSSDLAGGVFSPNDGKIDPIRFVQAVEVAARERGVDIRKEIEVIGFERKGRRIEAVETTNGRIVADTVVMAAGVWSRDLLATIGMRLPIEGAKGYYVEVDAEPGELQMPIHIHESLVIMTPFDDRIRLAGTLELTDLDPHITRSRVNAIVDAGELYLSGIMRRVRRVGRGIRPLTPDGLPLIGRAQRYDNLILATGHGMIGIALAPVTGRIVLGLIEGSALPYDTTMIDPERFSSLRAGRPRVGRARFG